MPQNKKSKDLGSQYGLPIIKLIPIAESKDDALERKKRVQALLSQMFLRAEKRGRPSKHETDEELKNAA